MRSRHDRDTRISLLVTSLSFDVHNRPLSIRRFLQPSPPAFSRKRPDVHYSEIASSGAFRTYFVSHKCDPIRFIPREYSFVRSGRIRLRKHFTHRNLPFAQNRDNHRPRCDLPNNSRRRYRYSAHQRLQILPRLGSNCYHFLRSLLDLEDGPLSNQNYRN